MSTAVLMTALLFGAADAQGTVLVEAGVARCSIVIPDDAGATVRHAAGELAGYLERMSGAGVPIAADGKAPPGVRIDVGATRKARAVLPKGFFDEEERVFIHTTSDGVVICGGGDRGTLFGVYRFLEQLGCRWLTPEPDNEIVPERSTVRVGPIEIDTRPAFAWRMFKGAVGSSRVDLQACKLEYSIVSPK